MTYRIVKIDESLTFNLKGWMILKDNGETLKPFTTRREAELLLEFFGTNSAKDN